MGGAGSPDDFWGQLLPRSVGQLALVERDGGRRASGGRLAVRGGRSDRW